jgi:DNA-binding transcriptional MerR regulator
LSYWDCRTFTWFAQYLQRFFVLETLRFRDIFSKVQGWASLDKMEDVRDAIYSMGAVVKMLGVPAQTLRSWEDRYHQVVPERSPGGHRLYTREQIDQLRFILEELDRGLQPADAHRLLEERRRYPIEPRSGEDQAVTILIAERDPFAAEYSEYFLRTEGYAVHVSFDFESARAVLEEDPPSVAVIDLLISGGTGLDLCRLAQNGGTARVLAISSLDSRDQALRVGADAFLLKPLDPLQFVSTVRDLLGTSAYLRGSVRVP